MMNYISHRKLSACYQNVTKLVFKHCNYALSRLGRLLPPKLLTEP